MTYHWPKEETASNAYPTGDIHDFDFFFGNWSVHNRRLKQRFVGSSDWEEFTGITRCEPKLGHAANVEEICFPTQGWSGLTLHLFDRHTRRWSIYWTSSEGATLFPPVQGGFIGDHGEFFGEDHDDGRAVQVKFVWEKQGAIRARWSQAFSLDGIRWETNWVMDFTRMG
ncbi:MAG TPA: hypothetical protein VIN06_03125 [Devosia sp.]